VRWLADSGYLRHTRENCVVFFDAVLTAKGLEALVALPESLTPRRPLGETLTAAVADGGKAALADAIEAVLAAGAAWMF